MFTVLDDFRDEYGIAAYWLGAIVGIGFFASFIAQILLAPIADRGHARRMVVGGLLLNIVGMLAMAIGDTVIVLLVGRFISGIGIGMAFPAVRRIVISGDPDNLGSNLGLLLSSDVAGFAAGPVISAILVPTFGIPAPFITIAVLTFLLLPVVFRVQVVESTQPATSRFAFDMLRSRPMVAALIMGSAVFLMIGTFDVLWAIVLEDLGAGDLIANIGITIFALPLILFASYGGRLAQRVGPFLLGPLGLVIAAVFMFTYGLLPSGIAMLSVAMFHAVTDGVTVGSTGIAVGLVAPLARQAGAQGMLGAAETLTGGITALLAGLLYSWGGRTLAYTTCSMLMIVMAVTAFVLAGPEYRARRGVHIDLVPDPATAVTGHA
jgi:MFS family permease